MKIAIAIWFKGAYLYFQEAIGHSAIWQARKGRLFELASCWFKLAAIGEAEMQKQTAIKRLRAAGFEIDWSVTGRGESGYFGTIDPIGGMSINGDCRGCVILADSADEFYSLAVQEAESLSGDLSLCDKEDCDFHDDTANKC